MQYCDLNKFIKTHQHTAATTHFP